MAKRLLTEQVRNYQWKNGLKMIKRNRKQVFFSLLGSFSYFLCLGLGLSLRRVLREYIRIEEAPLYEGELVDSTLGQLIDLLSGVEIGIVMMLIGLLIFGYFFFYTGLRRQLILHQEEIAIKQLLGSSLSHVTHEFYLEYVLPIVVAGLAGLLSGVVILGVIYLIVTIGYLQNWPTPWYHPFKVNGLIIIVVALIIKIHYWTNLKLITKEKSQ